jgi:hypothetical protein
MRKGGKGGKREMGRKNRPERIFRFAVVIDNIHLSESNKEEEEERGLRKKRHERQRRKKRRPLSSPSIQFGIFLFRRHQPLLSTQRRRVRNQEEQTAEEEMKKKKHTLLQFRRRSVGLELVERPCHHIFSI